MATLVLTAVGTAVGGPIGGAIGALVGQAVDSVIFRPKGREGPRLADLRVQTSTYGTRIPSLHGRLRVAGTVIWSTDLIERSETSRSGKSQPSVTSYSYSASFAVALSSRPVGALGRIWADGNLLRGAGGDFKSPLGAFRLHAGEEGQAPDPLIAAAVGLDRASAHRGLAYAVFEDLDLADFGNRIPTLTFEVIADDGEIRVEDIASTALKVPVQTEALAPPLPLGGFASDGASARETLAPLIETFGLRYREGEDGGITLTRGRLSTSVLTQSAQIRRADGASVEASEFSRRSMEDVPARISLRYYDPARDYQAGVQSAERAGVGQTALTVDFPATLTAGVARQMADEQLPGWRRGGAGLRCIGWMATMPLPSVRSPGGR